MQVSVLGCGWLGLPLAKALTGKGTIVKGSTTSPQKLEQLQENKIVPYLLTLKDDGITGNPDDFLNGSGLLIMDFPPKLRGEENITLLHKVRNLIPHIERSGIEKVLFISSISVYGNNSGAITEDTPPNPDTESAKQLLETELLLQSNPFFKTTVLRFAGLISEDRHPVYYLAAKEDIPDPDAPVNLIHRDDCIGIILKIMENDIWGETFNAASPHHPSRKEYYTQKAEMLGLTPPKFQDKGSNGKIISPDKVMGLLGYDFVEQTL